MAHAASDGKRFTNLPPMKAHQRSLDAKGGAKDPLAMPGQGGEMGGDESPEAVVAEHGPATEVMTTHDHEAGKHHVHSKHGDGHETDSEHESAEAAGDHAKALGMDSQGMDEGDGGGMMGGAGGGAYE